MPTARRTPFRPPAPPTQHASAAPAAALFGSTTSTSTATVTETSSSITIYQETSTFTEVATASIVETATATPVQTIPANPVLYGGSQNFLSITPRSLARWTNTSAPTGREIEVVGPVGYTRSDGTLNNTANNFIVRVQPSNTPNSYIALSDTVVARPLRTYSVSFDYRCLNFDPATAIDVYYLGRRVGGALTCSCGNFVTAWGITFTTNETGLGELEVRFVNPSENPNTYFYFDEVVARVV